MKWLKSIIINQFYLLFFSLNSLYSQNSRNCIKYCQKLLSFCINPSCSIVSPEIHENIKNVLMLTLFFNIFETYLCSFYKMFKLMIRKNRKDEILTFVKLKKL